MSNKSQIKILKNILAVTYFVAQVLGLWPFNINMSSRCIKYNFFKLIYSIVLPFIVLYSYYTFGILTLSASRSTNVLHSSIMEILPDFYCIIIMLSYILLCVGQHLKFEILKMVFLKCVEIVDLLQKYPNRSDSLRKYFVNFFVKTVVVDIFNLLVLYYNLSRSSKVISFHPYLPLILYSPLMIVRFYENIFYGGVMILDIIFKQLNKNLLGIVTMEKSSEIQRRTNVGKFCQLSDELDKLSELHFKLSEATKVFNSIFDVQLLLWMVVEIAGLIMRCFYQYISIVSLLENSHENYGLVVWQNFVTLVITSLTWVEILWTSHACESLANEVSIISFDQ